MAALAVGLLALGAGFLLPSLSKAKAKGQHIAARLSESESREETRLRRELEATAAKAGLLDKEPARQPDQARDLRRGGGTVESLERHAAQARGGAADTTPTAGEPVASASPGGPPAAGEARPQIQDVRMMMRYGLVPKGFKIDLEDRGGRVAAPASRPAPAAEPQPQVSRPALAGQLGQWFFTATNRAAVDGNAFYFNAANGAASRGLTAGTAGGGFVGGGFGGFGGAPGAAQMRTSFGGGMGGGGTGGPAARGELESVAPPTAADTDAAIQVVAPSAPAITAPTPTVQERKDGVPVLGDRAQPGALFVTAARGRDPAADGAEAGKAIELEALPLKLPAPAFMGAPTDIPLGDAKSRAMVQETLAPHPTATAGRFTADTAAAAPPAEAAGQRVESLELADVFQPVPEDRAQLGRALAESERQVARRAREAMAEDSFQFNVPADNLAEGDALLQSNALVREEAGKPAIQAGEKLAKVVAGYESRQELTDVPAAQPAALPPVPQPETATAENAFSTFSLNVADVSFKLAAASLEAGRLPEPAAIRVEEFVNAFDYRDPAPAPGVPVAFHWERARHPFAHNRDLARFSVQTAAQGREPGRALNLVLVLDSSGSMERADRVAIIREAVRVLAGQLQPADKISVVTFARQARLWVDGLPGSQAGELPARVGELTPEGGTNLEDALKLGYETAARHFLPGGVNRVILLTDGAANLGDVVPASLQRMVESHRQRGLALDCFGIGWDGYNDELLEVLSRRGDGRYGFVNSPDEAASGFAAQLAGALRVAAADVKVQVEFNPARVNHWRQIGYAKHQLTKEQFRDNTVDAAEIGAAEAGTALYALEVNPQGQGPLGVFRVRYREPATGQYREHERTLAYPGKAPALEAASPAMRLAAVAALFGEWLSQSPFAGDASPDRLLGLFQGVPEAFAPDSRPKQLEWMLRQAQSLGGR
jgi:Mg-chelatase subunit ChlD